MKSHLRVSSLLLFVLLPLLIAGTAAAVGWAPKDSCFSCHPEIWNKWVTSGHPYKLRPAEEARRAGLPLPSGYSWDDISWVIGGRHRKIRYLDQDGYIITVTGPKRDVKGLNQYNMETGRWVDYSPGEKKKYDCGPCHMTGYRKEGNQESMEGAVGTWKYGGITCEGCHGGGGEHVASDGDTGKITVNRAADLCGICHIRGEKGKIPAAGGFIQHHEQFNEQQSSKMQKVACIECHDPHLPARIGQKKACAECHDKAAKDYAGSSMEKAGVSCKDCHMPKLVKSAEAFGKYEGDIRTHLFGINLAPEAVQFSEDGKFANAYVTVEFACLSCHRSRDRAWALQYAKGIHTTGRK